MERCGPRSTAPAGGDEVNIIQKGRNYGWPVISWGLMDNGLPTETTSKPGMEQPVAHYEPSPGIAPMLFYNGSKYPNWKGNVLIGFMGHEELRRLTVNGTRVTEQEVLFKGLGRVRDFVLGTGWAAVRRAGESGSAAFRHDAGSRRAVGASTIDSWRKQP